jgi:hypothetical protein
MIALTRRGHDGLTWTRLGTRSGSKVTTSCSHDRAIPPCGACNVPNFAPGTKDLILLFFAGLQICAI